MDCFRLICSKEVKDGPIGLKGHGYDFLRFEGNNPYGIFGERTQDHGDHSEIFDRFNEKLKETRPHLAGKKVLFHHDNVPAHSSGIVSAKLHGLRYELLPNPLYSSDLVPCDFFLFLNMKMWLAVK